MQSGYFYKDFTGALQPVPIPVTTMCNQLGLSYQGVNGLVSKWLNWKGQQVEHPFSCSQVITNAPFGGGPDFLPLSDYGEDVPIIDINNPGNIFKVGDTQPVKDCKVKCLKWFPNNLAFAYASALVCEQTNGIHPDSKCDYIDNYMAPGLDKTVQSLSNLCGSTIKLFLVVLLIVIIIAAAIFAFKTGEK